DDQRVLGPENRIRIEIFVPLHKQVSCKWRKTIRRNEQMNVSRSERMTAQRPQQLPNGTIVRYWIGDGFNAHEAVASFTIAAEFAAQIHLGLFRVLLLVQTVLVRLPDIKQRVS